MKRKEWCRLSPGYGYAGWCGSGAIGYTGWWRCLAPIGLAKCNICRSGGWRQPLEATKKGETNEFMLTKLRFIGATGLFSIRTVFRGQVIDIIGQWPNVYCIGGQANT